MRSLSLFYLKALFVFFKTYQGGLLSKDKKKIFFIGVIDILTEFV